MTFRRCLWLKEMNLKFTAFPGFYSYMYFSHSSLCGERLLVTCVWFYLYLLQNICVYSSSIEYLIKRISPYHYHYHVPSYFVLALILIHYSYKTRLSEISLNLIQSGIIQLQAREIRAFFFSFSRYTNASLCFSEKFCRCRNTEQKKFSEACLAVFQVFKKIVCFRLWLTLESVYFQRIF